MDIRLHLHDDWKSPYPETGVKPYPSIEEVFDPHRRV